MKKILLIALLLLKVSSATASKASDNQTNTINLDNKTTKQLYYKVIAVILHWHEPTMDITINNFKSTKNGHLDANQETTVSMENAIHINHQSPAWLLYALEVCTANKEKCALYKGNNEPCGSAYKITEHANGLKITKLPESSLDSETIPHE